MGGEGYLGIICVVRINMHCLISSREPHDTPMRANLDPFAASKGNVCNTHQYSTLAWRRGGMLSVTVVLSLLLWSLNRRHQEAFVRPV